MRVRQSVCLYECVSIVKIDLSSRQTCVCHFVNVLYDYSINRQDREGEEREEEYHREIHTSMADAIGDAQNMLYLITGIAKKTELKVHFIEHTCRNGNE